MVIFRPYFKVIVKPITIGLTMTLFDSDFEIRLKYYRLHSTCSYFNLRSARRCFSELASCFISLNCRLVRAFGVTLQHRNISLYAWLISFKGRKSRPDSVAKMQFQNRPAGKSNPRALGVTSFELNTTLDAFALG